MSKPVRNLRLFVGAYPPREVAEAMVASLGSIDLPEHRLVRADQIHLTLQFIGDTPVKQMDATCESVERSAAGIDGFELTPQRLITLPKRGPRRLVVTETDAPGRLLELQRRLATRLAHEPRRNASDRYLPHLTLCRFTRPRRMPAIDVPLEIPSFTIDRILLMRSTLTSQGAAHEVIVVCQLPDRSTGHRRSSEAQGDAEDKQSADMS